jgi:hypothetical protein
MDGVQKEVEEANMSSLDKARETQLANIQAKTGKTLAELRGILQASGLSKHGDLRKYVIDQFGLGFGDATMLVHFAQESDGQTAAEVSGASLEDVINEIYSGPKASLRIVHDEVIRRANTFGEFEIVPKKGYVSLRRKRQFAMVGPGSKGRLEVGINMKDVPSTERLVSQPPGGMCQYKVFLTSMAEVDEEFIQWMRFAYDHAS